MTCSACSVAQAQSLPQAQAGLAQAHLVPQAHLAVAALVRWFVDVAAVLQLLVAHASVQHGLDCPGLARQSSKHLSSHTTVAGVWIRRPPMRQADGPPLGVPPELTSCDTIRAC